MTMIISDGSVELENKLFKKILINLGLLVLNN